MKINKRAIVMREAITAIVPMLVNRKIEVRQQGVQAYVRYDAAGEPDLVNLPCIPDDASNELLDAIQGFLDHECGHILFSEVSVLREAIAKPGSGKEAQLTEMLYRYLEDIYIEKKMSEKFLGSGLNLDKVREFFLINKIEPDLKMAQDDETRQAIMMMPAMRAWGGQATMRDFMSTRWGSLSDIQSRIGEDVEDIIQGVGSSAECLIAARTLAGRLAAPKPPEPSSSDDSESESDTAESPKPDPKAKPEPAPTAEPEPKPEPAPEPENKPEPGDDPAPNDKEAPGDSPVEEDTPAPDEDPADGGEDSAPPDAGDEPEDPAPPPAGDAGDEDTEDDDAGGAPPPGGDAGDEDDDSGGDTPADTDPADGGAESDPTQSGDAEEADAVSDGEAPTGGNPLPPQQIDKLIENASDFDDAMSDLISEQAAEGTARSKYKAFTTDNDKIGPMSLDGFTDAKLRELTQSMQEQVDGMINGLQKDMERAVAARSAAVWTGGHRSGRLHGASLYRLGQNRDDVFRRKQDNHTKNVCVELVIDASGSMGGDKITVAATAAYALSAVLDRLNIRHGISAFTTMPPDSATMAAANEETAKFGIKWSRLQGINIPIIKTPDERLTPTVRQRLAVLAGNEYEEHDGMNANLDGESVMLAARRLAVQREQRKILIVLSDGLPSSYPGDGAAQAEHLKSVVKTIGDSGIDVLGIGIQDESVKKFYPRHVILQDVEDLPKTVMKEIKQRLLQ